MPKPFLSETSEQKIGKAICDMIHSAEIRYLNFAGEFVYSQHIGRVSPGDTIEVKVPTPAEFKFDAV